MGRRLTSMAAVVLAATSLASAALAAEVSSPTLAPSGARPAAPAPAQGPAAQLPTDRVLGRADAPITIIEYASFTCSHCATFANTVLPELKTRYIDTGKAKLIFRDLPTAPVQLSNIAAAIGRCAAPGRFFDVANYLMGNQSEAFANQKLQEWLNGAVAASGRTQEQIEECVRLPATAESLSTDTASAVASGVNSTPALFVNGRRVEDHSLNGMIAAIQPLVR